MLAAGRKRGATRRPPRILARLSTITTCSAQLASFRQSRALRWRQKAQQHRGGQTQQMQDVPEAHHALRGCECDVVRATGGPFAGGGVRAGILRSSRRRPVYRRDPGTRPCLTGRWVIPCASLPHGSSEVRTCLSARESFSPFCGPRRWSPSRGRERPHVMRLQELRQPRG